MLQLDPKWQKMSKTQGKGVSMTGTASDAKVRWGHDLQEVSISQDISRFVVFYFFIFYNLLFFSPFVKHVQEIGVTLLS